MNKDLIDFTDSILGRYNATPDEWDAFESIKWSMNTTHKISAVFFPQRNEVEATWENIATGKRAGATFPVTPDQGEDIAEVLMPCVYQDAACEQRGVRAELKTKPPRWRTGVRERERRPRPVAVRRDRCWMFFDTNASGKGES